MSRKEIIELIRKKRSFLCIGLDADPALIPACLRHYDDPVLEFNKRIIEATSPYCVAYKINTAFYEAQGAAGWQTMLRTRSLIPSDALVIADAKRADVQHSSHQYVKAFFDRNAYGEGFDAITVSPYLGYDALQPFLNYAGKWTIVLALTSNSGAIDFQLQPCGRQGRLLYEEVIAVSRQWGSPENMMYVIGATHVNSLPKVRRLIPEHFLLIPGVGSQGGSLADVVKSCITPSCGLLVNVSRAVLYAANDAQFAVAAAEVAQSWARQMEAALRAHTELLKVS